MIEVLNTEPNRMGVSLADVVMGDRLLTVTYDTGHRLVEGMWPHRDQLEPVVLVHPKALENGGPSLLTGPECQAIEAVLVLEVGS